MDFKIQITGLNELLGVIYGEETKLSTLLRELGFEQPQIEQVRDQHLEAVTAQFLEVIHERLTSDSGRDTYYQILARRYGLDGQTPAQLSAIAEAFKHSPESLRQLFDEILQRCKSKTWQAELKKSLKHIVIQKLGELNQKPSQEHIADKLKRLENLRGAADVARLDYEAKRADILKQIQSQLDALDSEYKPLLESAEENIATLENEIKTDVLLYGESVTSGHFRATYSKGRISWDNEGMEKYAAAHPDVIQFRKQGQPIVTLRVVNKD
ncbi:MAG: hypothetical protein IH588_07480 [Anaerolineales bacterium]|nr:hypothetical protein [Anaerolineales bacterium]